MAVIFVTDSHSHPNTNKELHGKENQKSIFCRNRGQNRSDGDDK